MLLNSYGVKIWCKVLFLLCIVAYLFNKFSELSAAPGKIEFSDTFYTFSEMKELRETVKKYKKALKEYEIKYSNKTDNNG